MLVYNKKTIKCYVYIHIFVQQLVTVENSMPILDTVSIKNVQFNSEQAHSPVITIINL